MRPTADDSRPGGNSNVTVNEVRELVKLATSSTDGLGASSSFVVDAAVCRRYLTAAATTPKPGPAETLPYLLSTARWRDENQVESLQHDRMIGDYERHL